MSVFVLWEVSGNTLNWQLAHLSKEPNKCLLLTRFHFLAFELVGQSLHPFHILGVVFGVV